MRREKTKSAPGKFDTGRDSVTPPPPSLPGDGLPEAIERNRQSAERLRMSLRRAIDLLTQHHRVRS